MIHYWEKVISSSRRYAVSKRPLVDNSRLVLTWSNIRETFWSSSTCMSMKMNLLSLFSLFRCCCSCPGQCGSLTLKYWTFSENVIITPETLKPWKTHIIQTPNSDNTRAGNFLNGHGARILRDRRVIYQKSLWCEGESRAIMKLVWLDSTGWENDGGWKGRQ